MSAVADPVVGYSEFERVDGKVFATASYESGVSKRCEVRVSVDREHRRADGSLVAAGEVASTDDGSVRIPEGASL